MGFNKSIALTIKELQLFLYIVNHFQMLKSICQNLELADITSVVFPLLRYEKKAEQVKKRDYFLKIRTPQ